MGYKDFSDLDLNTNNSPQNVQTFQAGTGNIQVPDESYIRDADLARDGMDLVLEGPHGTVVIEGYFAADPQPTILSGGQSLTPSLVHSFVKSPMQYADAGSATDESPVGAVQEVKGEATVTRADGTTEKVALGTPIYQGDVIETTDDGAVNIVFIDETSFAVSEDARLAIDEYVFDPSTQSGTSNFSVLKGVFVFTSGLIGRDDPDDVEIDTPVGSIGIRGTIIAGNVDTGEITVVEGAIVLRDFNGNELTLALQFETARFGGEDGITHIGQLDADDVSARFESISDVSPDLFSSIQDAANENKGEDAKSGDDGHDDAGDDSTGDGNDGVNDDNSGLPGDDDNGGLPDDGDNSQGHDDGNDGNHDDGNNDGDDGRDDGDNDGDGRDDNPPPPPGGDNGTSNPVFLHDATPDGLFAGANGGSWQHNFNHDFAPGGPGGANQVTHWALTPATAQMLSALGITVNGDFATTGILELTFPTNFNDTDFANLLSSGILDLGIIAGDADGDHTTAHFDFQLFDNVTQYTHGSGSGPYDGSNTYNDTGSSSETVILRNFDVNLRTLNIENTDDDTFFFADGVSQDSYGALGQNATGNTVYLGNGENHFTLGLLGNGVDSNTVYGGDDVDVITIKNDASNNLIYTGAGNDQITTDATSTGSGNIVHAGLGDDTFNIDGTGNTYYGEGGNDTFNIDNADNTFHGGLGNDTFNIDVADLSTFNVGTHIEGGSGIDTLAFEGTGTNIDFSSIGGITGVEHIDLTATGSQDIINLTDDAVLNMTDGDNILVINLNSNDSVDVDDFTYTEDRTIDGVHYDVFIGDNGVTLLIEDTTNGDGVGQAANVT